MGSVCVRVTLQMLPIVTVMLSTESPNFHVSGCTEHSLRSTGPSVFTSMHGHGTVLEQIENTYGFISAALGTLHEGTGTAN